MMEKLVISEETKKDLEHLYFLQYEKDLLHNQFQKCANNERVAPVVAHFYNKHLENKITPQQFALLLCGWYVVEQPFQVGDWVYHKTSTLRNEYVGRLTNITSNNSGWIDRSYKNGNQVSAKMKELRHATPEEIAQEKKRRFWAELGREVDEYKIGDIVAKNGNIQEISGVLRDGWKIQTYSLPVYNGELTLICPVERRMDT